MQDATVKTDITEPGGKYCSPKSVKEKNCLRAAQKGICSCQLSVSVAGCPLASCHPIIHGMPMGHFMGGGTYVSAGAVPCASDMEQGLSKGPAHLSSQPQTAGSALICLCLLALRARTDTTRSIFQICVLDGFWCCSNCCRNAVCKWCEIGV